MAHHHHIVAERNVDWSPRGAPIVPMLICSVDIMLIASSAVGFPVIQSLTELKFEIQLLLGLPVVVGRR